MSRDLEPASGPSSDALQLVADVPLTPDEADYVAKARSANTLRGYRSDWAEFTAWCTSYGYDPIPAEPAAVSQYLTELARHSAKVGTMSRRISAIRFAHTLRQLPDPADHARVQAVWEGIRRSHATPAEQSAPLMPPVLFDVIDACPVTKTWKTPGASPARLAVDLLPWTRTARCIPVKREKPYVAFTSLVTESETSSERSSQLVA